MTLTRRIVLGWLLALALLAPLAACEDTEGMPRAVAPAGTTTPAEAPPALAPGAQMPPGHPSVNAEDAVDSKALLAKVEAMKEQIKDKPKTLEIMLALGSLYYDNTKYLDAVDYFRQAIALGQPFVDYDAQLRHEVGPVDAVKLIDAGCDRSQLHDSDQIVARAKQLHGEKKDAFAVACADEAMSPVVTAHTRRGNAFYLVGNPTSAVTEHERAIALDPTCAESLFFRGAILFDALGDDVPKLKQARESWQQFLKIAPDNPRAAAVKEMLPQLEQAIVLGGVSKLPKMARPAGHPSEEEEDTDEEQPEALPPGHPSAPGQPIAGPLDPGAAEAVRTADIDAETIASMSKVLDTATGQIAKGDMANAVVSLKSVFPFTMAQPDKFPPAFRARSFALMSLYMASKGAPMATALLTQAVQAAPAAVDQVGDALIKAGDATHAKQMWAAIRANDAAYATQAKLDEKLSR